MAGFDINPNSQGYKKLLASVKDVRTTVVPQLKSYAKFPKDRQLAWVQSDELLREVILLAHDVLKADVDVGDVGEVD